MKQSRSRSGVGNFKAPGSVPGLRRMARECALQCLFQMEVQGFEPTAADSDFWRLRSAPLEEDDPDGLSAPPPLPPKARTFAESLVLGVCSHRAHIDSLLEKFTVNFRLERLAAVDRNILRLAVYELLVGIDAPPPVVINEAIEIAKRFGTEDSGRFVNGLLDRIKLEIKSGPRELPTAPPPHSEESPAPKST